VRTRNPIEALVAECEIRHDRRELPADVVNAIASALADAIAADIMRESSASTGTSNPANVAPATYRQGA
jgi:hypothetical protein